MAKSPKRPRARVRASADEIAGVLADALRRILARRWTPALAAVPRRRR